MSGAPDPDLPQLKARFVRLLVVESAAGALAVAFAILYFAFHIGWTLPAFVLTLVGAAAAQVRFIVQFNRTPG